MVAWDESHGMVTWDCVSTWDSHMGRLNGMGYIGLVKWDGSHGMVTWDGHTGWVIWDDQGK